MQKGYANSREGLPSLPSQTDLETRNLTTTCFQIAQTEHGLVFTNAVAVEFFGLWFSQLLLSSFKFILLHLRFVVVRHGKL